MDPLLARFIEFYQQQHLSIFPLAPSSKKPIVKWKRYQSQKPSDFEIEEWFRRPGLNIGIICGLASGGLLVQDFEEYEAFSQFYPSHARLQDETLVVTTPGGGTHVYWLSLKPVRRSIRLSKDPALDLLGEGGYVAGPPSIVNSRPYEVVSKLQIGLLSSDPFEATLRRCRQLGWKTSGLSSMSTPPASLPHVSHLGPSAWRRLSETSKARIVDRTVPVWSHGRRNDLTMCERTP